MKFFKLIAILSLFCCFLQSCNNQQNTFSIDFSSPLFSKIDQKKSGITFKNTVNSSDQNNLKTNDYLFAGGGISVGDINNDGLQDILFISNSSQPALYLNKSKFEFVDITKKSGIKIPKGWSTGSSFVDINQDGYLDIYICRGGQHIKDQTLKRNLLYINNGDLTFTEKGKQYGLDDSGTSIQATFFDFDKDGDLDVYLLNLPKIASECSIDEFISNRNNTNLSDLKYSDSFYENLGNNTFKNKTSQVGLANYGHGLSVAITDINNDNWPDIYLTNNFVQPDYLYANNQNGTFSDRILRSFNHNTRYASGVDAADMNNDGWMDIFELNQEKIDINQNKIDSINSRLKKAGYLPQYQKNGLQINRGGGYKFSDIANIEGVQETGHSWSTILLDLNDDGNKDILITNGLPVDSLLSDRKYDLLIDHSEKNNAFKNNGNLSFDDFSSQWGLDYKGNSNGLAYGDLDNDGDLDVIINNINTPPIIYKNTSRERGKNYINFKLKGFKGNLNGIGSKITIYTSNGIQKQELYTTRGFQSSSQNILHFGLGSVDKINKVEIVWPNDKMQTITNIGSNKMLELNQKDATESYIPFSPKTKYFIGASIKSKLRIIHQDFFYDDFKYDKNLPNKLSQLGPFIAVGDINGDRKDDFYVGGSANISGSLYLSKPDLTYDAKTISAFLKDSIYEDMESLFFDCDQDGDLDLYVVSGSNQFTRKSKKYQDRLYINDGKGIFTKSQNLPEETESGSCVVASDFDMDGDLDLFIGGRISPGNYPSSSKSMLLQNNNGKFVNITSKIGSELENLGMVTSAIWSDYDNDGDDDLLVVGELMSIHIFQNTNGQLIDISDKVGLDSTVGRWNKIIEWDFDKDGKMDFVIGNIGQNYKPYKTEKDQLLTSIILKNTTTGFKVIPLPKEVQFSSVNALQLYDIDHDTEIELLLAGNMYQVKPNTTRQDASVGTIVKFSNGKFITIPMLKSGWYCPGDVKDLKILSNDIPYFLIANNNSRFQLYTIKNEPLKQK